MLCIGKFPLCKGKECAYAAGCVIHVLVFFKSLTAFYNGCYFISSGFKEFLHIFALERGKLITPARSKGRAFYCLSINKT